jgi:hypothetical protein
MKGNAEESPFKMAAGIASRAKFVTNTPRLTANAGLIGTSVLVVLALLTLPRLDGPLMVALHCAAVAISVLGLSFLVGAIRVRIKGTAPLPAFLRLYLHLMAYVIWILEAVVGWGAVIVGFGALYVHFAGSVLVTAIAAFVGFPLLAYVITLVIIRTRHRARLQRIVARYRKMHMPAPSSAPEAQP